MKKILIPSLFFVCTTFSSQKVSDLKFENNFADAEDSYVALPNKDKNKKEFSVGFVYFDEAAGYTLDYSGDLKEENGILIYEERKDAKISSMKYRLGNFDAKVAKLDNIFLDKLNLNSQPDWLKFYKTSKSENEKIVRRASMINGSNYPQIALPKLKKLYDNNYKSTDLFFEISYSYNALGDFASAEKFAKEGIDNKMSNDNLIKEYIYSLLNQKKAKLADTFLSKNLSFIKDNTAKLEAVNNMTAYSAQMDELNISKKWFEEYKKIATDDRYKRQIETLDKLIKENDKTSK